MAVEIKWDDSLSIGVEAMDKQHQILIDYIGDLVKAVETDSNALRAFDTLAEYVVKHFKEEEEFMASINFEGLDSHKIIHQDLLKRVGGYREQIESNTLDAEALFSFLRVWLTSHIKGIDAKYGKVSQQ